MTPEISKALEELQGQFPGQVSWQELPNGSVRVTVDYISLGKPYSQAETWFGFTITALHPYADVYPHFVRPDLSRIDGGALGQAFQRNIRFYDTQAVQVSRRTKLFGPDHPVSPVLKLLKVHQWMLSQ